MNHSTRLVGGNLGSQFYSGLPNCFWKKKIGLRLSQFCVISLYFVLLGLGPAPHAKGHAGIDPEIHEITEKLEKEPNRVDLWIQRGQVYRSYGKYAESLQDIEKAWLLDRDNKEIALERSLTLSAMGRDTDAEAVLNQLLQQDLGPLQVFALAERAVIRARTGRPELAINDFTSVLRLQPTGELYLRRGKLQESMGRLEEAALGYTEGIAKLGDSILLKIALIEVRITQGKFNEALLLIEDQIPRTPVKTQWYLKRAEVLDQMGQSEAARKSYEQALSEANRILGKRPTAIHLVERAKILKAMGQQDDAIRDLREVLQKFPRYDEAEKLLQQWGGQLNE